MEYKTSRVSFSTSTGESVGQTAHRQQYTVSSLDEDKERAGDVPVGLCSAGLLRLSAGICCPSPPRTSLQR